MIKNPLAIYVTAALASAGGLVMVNQNQMIENTVDAELVVIPVPLPEPEVAAVQPELEPRAEPVAPSQPEPQPAHSGESAVDGPERRKTRFDIVRVEETGETVIAGGAEPGAQISIKLNDQVIGTTTAKEDGSWVVIPEHTVPAGGHSLTAETRMDDETVVISEEVVTVVIPEDPNGEPLVILSQPQQPSIVLQKPEPAEQQTAAVEPGVVVDEDAIRPDETPAVSAQGTQTAQTEVATAIEETQSQAAPELVDEMSPDEQAEPVEVEVAIAAPEGVDTDLTEPTPPETDAASKPAAPRTTMPVTLDVIDYNDAGDILFAGRANPGATVRLYVDNRHIGDALANHLGDWGFRGRESITAGQHNLRVDQLTASGHVSHRVELPFVRADSAAVAELARQRSDSAGELEPVPTETVQQDAPAPPAVEVEEEIVIVQTEVIESSDEPAEPTLDSAAALETDVSVQAPVDAPRVTVEVGGAAVAPEEADVPAQTPASPAEPVAETVEIESVTVSSQPEPAQIAGQEEPDLDAGALIAAVPATSQPVETPAADSAPLSGRVIIQPGNNLWNISRVIYGRGIQYTVIFTANKDQIRNPNLIYPGQIFTTPGTVSPDRIAPGRRTPLSAAEIELLSAYQ